MIQLTGALLSASTALIVLISLGYVVLLNVFRTSIHENDNYLFAVLQVIFSVILVILEWIADGLPGSLRINSEILIALTALYFAFKMHRYYVAGVKYKITNLDGKVYIITGSNTGLGYETAKQIVKMGGTVILACRSIDKAKQAKDYILEYTKCSTTKVIVLKLDLCNFESVRKFVKEFKSLSIPLHGLINNAGVILKDRNLTGDGFEMVFTANHLSHFLLTNLLLSELEKNNGRIINLTSSLYKSVPTFNFNDVMSERNYSLFGTYAQSKLANILFTIELQRRINLKGTKVTCNAVHPGCVRTEVTRNMNMFMQVGQFIAHPLMFFLRKSPQEGASTSIHVATSLELEGKGGLYFYHCKPCITKDCAKDLIAAERLWALSEKLTGLSH